MKRMILIGLAVVLTVAGGAVWMRGPRDYPSPPDIRTAGIEEITTFIGHPDFNRMTERHRRQYVEGAIERLREKQFGELVSLILGPSHKEQRTKAFKNINKLRDAESLGYKMYGVAIEKYYELPALMRGIMLGVVARLTDADIRANTDAIHIPTQESFTKQFDRFVAEQSPRTQALHLQFVMDLQRQREKLGMPYPFDKPAPPKGAKGTTQPGALVK